MGPATPGTEPNEVCLDGGGTLPLCTDGIGTLPPVSREGTGGGPTPAASCDPKPPGSGKH